MKISTMATTIIGLALLGTPPGIAATCDNKPAGSFSGQAVFKAGGAVGFASAKLAVDADGAPNSYQTDGKGLSFTCDGVNAIGSTPKTDPKHWVEKCNAAWKAAQASGDYSKLRIFGFEVGPRNVPIVQQPGDPLPNLGYISTTSVPVPDGPKGTQRHWIDATEIPYIVLSPSFRHKFGIGNGDIAVVYMPSSGKAAFAVYGDGGDLGEASVRLHQDIGSNPITVKEGVKRAEHGIETSTLTVVFPGHPTHPTVAVAKWRAEIARLGGQMLDQWGGMERLKACAQ